MTTEHQNSTWLSHKIWDRSLAHSKIVASPNSLHLVSLHKRSLILSSWLTANILGTAWFEDVLYFVRSVVRGKRPCKIGNVVVSFNTSQWCRTDCRDGIIDLYMTVARRICGILAIACIATESHEWMNSLSPRIYRSRPKKLFENVTLELCLPTHLRT